MSPADYLKKSEIVSADLLDPLVSVICPVVSKQSTWVVTPAEDASRLDQFLQIRAHCSRKHARSLIEEGAVYLNRKRTKVCSKTLRNGSVVQAFLKPQIKKNLNPLKMEDVLFEDSSLLLLSKPPGVPTHQTRDQDRSHLAQLAKAYLGKNAYLGIHHRLDVDTSGVILFSKDEKANPSIAEQFKTRAIKKMYIAIVQSRRKFPDEILVSTPLANKGKIQEAKTQFKRILSEEDDQLILACPETGRMHQIRKHLSEIGFPILGDTIYGGSRKKRVLLHSWRMSFLHPITDTPLSAQAPVPEDFLRSFPSRSKESILQTLLQRAP